MRLDVIAEKIELLAAAVGWLMVVSAAIAVGVMVCVSTFSD